ncbi:MAG: patatin-like phospholipase family protein [Caulobacteraceae bacterium]
MADYIKTYERTAFEGELSDGDIILKGGVTSGLVYPYAILELATKFRFRSIGGTSVGALAAAFAAAAEYSRGARGDAGGFLRMQARCEALPELLKGLFQASPRYRDLMRFAMRAQTRRSPLPMVWDLVSTFWLTTLAGLTVGAALMELTQSGPFAIGLGMLLGAVLALAARIGLQVLDLPNHAFGMCPGLAQPGYSGPALTDWMHQSIQDIAFGDPDHPFPLTFGDLAAADPPIDLRVITSNLSMGRPHTLPAFRLDAGYDPAAWARLFPAPVTAYLAARAEPLTGWAGEHPYKAFPAGDGLPLVIAARLSLSLPFVFTAVPMHMADLQGAALAAATGGDGTVRLRRVWFSDGGLASNFPIHMFDGLLPTRPTFALSLDDLPPGADRDGPRVFITAPDAEGAGLPVSAVNNLAAFTNSLMASAKDWQDNLLAGMPGQRERIARVLLDPATEGGFNLTMPRSAARVLMGYGLAAGQRLLGGLDFEEHCYRRALISYEQLETAIGSLGRTWKGGFAALFARQSEVSTAYPRLGQDERDFIAARLGVLADVALDPPPIGEPDAKFPRPQGRLRISPNT